MYIFHFMICNNAITGHTIDWTKMNDERLANLFAIKDVRTAENQRNIVLIKIISANTTTHWRSLYLNNDYDIRFINLWNCGKLYRNVKVEREKNV